MIAKSCHLSSSVIHEPVLKILYTHAFRSNYEFPTIIIICCLTQNVFLNPEYKLKQIYNLFTKSADLKARSHNLFSRMSLGSENRTQVFRWSEFKVEMSVMESFVILLKSLTIFNFTRKESKKYCAKFVGTFHLSRRVWDEDRACSISTCFYKVTDLCIERSFLLCSHNLIFGTNKNRILETGSCERSLTIIGELTNWKVLARGSPYSMFVRRMQGLGFSKGAP